jgi:hypothetical protein
MRWISFVATTLFVALAGVGFVRAQAESNSVVDVKARVEHVGPGKDVVIVRFDVQKGWQLCANPPGADDFAESATSIRIDSKDAVKVHVDYPAGTERDLAGLKFRVYVGKFEIRVTVDRDATATGALEAVVRFHAMDDRSCLVPSVVRIPLP